MKTPEELHREKLKEIGYKNEAIEELVLRYTENHTYGFAEQYANSALQEQIYFIENEAEIAMPIDEIVGKTKKEYGLVLIKYLAKELKELSSLSSKETTIDDVFKEEKEGELLKEAYVSMRHLPELTHQQEIIYHKIEKHLNKI